jgi:hypothetical protein
MATQKIPLNKFRSIYLDIPTVQTPVYGTPPSVATIIVNAQATNTTASDQTVNVWIRRGSSVFPVVYNMPIPAYDSRSLVSGRLVLQGIDGDLIINPDAIEVSASAAGVTLSLGWLETINSN